MVRLRLLIQRVVGLERTSRESKDEQPSSQPSTSEDLANLTLALPPLLEAWEGAERESAIDARLRTAVSLVQDHVLEALRPQRKSVIDEDFTQFKSYKPFEASIVGTTAYIPLFFPQIEFVLFDRQLELPGQFNADPRFIPAKLKAQRLCKEYVLSYAKTCAKGVFEALPQLTSVAVSVYQSGHCVFAASKTAEDWTSVLGRITTVGSARADVSDRPRQLSEVRRWATLQDCAVPEEVLLEHFPASDVRPPQLGFVEPLYPPGSLPEPEFDLSSYETVKDHVIRTTLQARERDWKSSHRMARGPSTLPQPLLQSPKLSSSRDSWLTLRAPGGTTQQLYWHQSNQETTDPARLRLAGS